MMAASKEMVESNAAQEEAASMDYNAWEAYEMAWEASGMVEEAFEMAWEASKMVEKASEMA